jgi:alkylated DNA repair dioxygenase AlkB
MVSIKGLVVIENYIPKTDEALLLATVGIQRWRGDLSRRVQHYGYIYDYKARTVDASMYLGPLPDWLQPLASRLHEDGLMPSIPDQAIINEYEPGQGIADHIDCTPCFGGVVTSLSLGGGVMMQFKRDELFEEVYLKPRTLLVMEDECRYQWTHGIPKRKTDVLNNHRILRQRRISITFRTVQLP